MKDNLMNLYVTDVKKVIAEVEQYKSDEDFWSISEGITNSGGTLTLHLIGNLKHYIGAVLGETGYVRTRDNEFSDRGVSREEIIGQLNEVVEMLKKTFGGLADEDLMKEYSEELGDQPQTTAAVIVYMLTHLNFHLGQINYHRRLLAGK